MDWFNKYNKYKTKYLDLKNILQIGGAEGGVTSNESSSNESKIKIAIDYAKTLKGVPYRWHIAGDPIQGDDKFYASNEPAVEREDIGTKCLVCSGLTNLMRRKVGLHVPGIEPLEFKEDDIIRWTDEESGEEQIFSWKAEGKNYPGTTGIWFHYLDVEKRLISFDESKEYPIGTMLLANYENFQHQGHVAVVSSSGVNILKQMIIHATSDWCYVASIKEGIVDVGDTREEPYENIKGQLIDILDADGKPTGGKEPWFKVTHVCLPEEWLLKD